MHSLGSFDAFVKRVVGEQEQGCAGAASCPRSLTIPGHAQASGDHLTQPPPSVGPHQGQIGAGAPGSASGGPQTFCRSPATHPGTQVSHSASRGPRFCALLLAEEIFTEHPVCAGTLLGTFICKTGLAFPTLQGQ